MSEKVHIVLSSDNTYAKYLSITIASVLCHAGEDESLSFHILDGGIEAGSKRKISGLVEQKRGSIEFIPVDAGMFSGMALNISVCSHVSPATYYRLLIPSLISAERCIYLDCDMLCRSSLLPLWQTDLQGSLVAAVKDIDEDTHSIRLRLQRYFNAGMLLMDLSSMRSLNIQKKFFEFIQAHHERIVMHDQDVINSVLDGKIKEIDMHWNVQVSFTRQCKKMGFLCIGRNAHIIHYIGHRKPWMYEKKVPYQCEYIPYILSSEFDELRENVPLYVLAKCKLHNILNI